MAKKSNADQAAVQVVLKCTYSDGKENPGPGTVLDLDAEEAARLIALGAAVAYEPPAVQPAEPAAE